jgi:uncharacterized protein
MDSTTLFTILLIGIAAGMLSGLVGIGGGIVLVPALIYFLKYNQQQAQGSSLGVLVLPVVILGFLQYYTACKKAGTPIDFKVIGLLAMGFLIGGFFGGKIANRIDAELLKKLFSVILLYTAFKMLGVDQWLMRWIRSVGQ